MYEDIVAQVQRTTEAAVQESRERVDLASQRSEEATKQAAAASKAASDRWTNRINAMRRRAGDRDRAAKSTEMRFGHEEGPHPADSTQGDELVSFTEQTTPSAAGQRPFGVPEELVAQQQQQPPVMHRPSPESARFMAGIGAQEEEPPPAPTFSPPTRRSAPPRRRPRDDDDDDYSGQSWLEGR